MSLIWLFLRKAAAYFARDSICDLPSSRNTEEYGRYRGSVGHSGSRAVAFMPGLSVHHRHGREVMWRSAARSGQASR